LEREGFSRAFSLRFSRALDRRFNRFEDLLIAGAATQAAGQRFANLVAGRIGDLVEQRLRRDEESRGAVPALRGAEIRERFLQRMEPAVRRQTFDGEHVAAFALGAKHKARQHRLSVQQHRTRAALAELASVLGAAQVQIFTQHLEKRFVGSERDFGRLAVHGQRELYVVRH